MGRGEQEMRGGRLKLNAAIFILQSLALYFISFPSVISSIFTSNITLLGILVLSTEAFSDPLCGDYRVRLLPPLI